MAKGTTVTQEMIDAAAQAESNLLSQATSQHMNDRVVQLRALVTALEEENVYMREQLGLDPDQPLFADDDDEEEGPSAPVTPLPRRPSSQSKGKKKKKG